MADDPKTETARDLPRLVLTKANDLRGALRAAIDRGLDTVETRLRDLVELARQLTARVDALAAQATAAAERRVAKTEDAATAPIPPNGEPSRPTAQA